MRILIGIVLAALLATLGLSFLVRLAPHDAARWHVDAETAADPGAAGFRVTRDLDMTPEVALAALDAIALATPRTRRLAGDPASGRITWVTRSRLMGYPDYATAQLQAGSAPGTARLVLLSRSRFGGNDWGVNRARLEGWLTRLVAP